MKIRIHNVFDGAVVGGLSAIIWTPISWQFFVVLFSWSIASAVAQKYDYRKV